MCLQYAMFNLTTLSVFYSKASAGIAVSQRKVRQISDPIQQILIQLHKIIYITQVYLSCMV